MVLRDWRLLLLVVVVGIAFTRPPKQNAVVSSNVVKRNTFESGSRCLHEGTDFSSEFSVERCAMVAYAVELDNAIIIGTFDLLIHRDDNACIQKKCRTRLWMV